MNNWTVHAQSFRSELSRLAPYVGVLARSRPTAVVVKETVTPSWNIVTTAETDLSHSLNRDQPGWIHTTGVDAPFRFLLFAFERLLTSAFYSEPHLMSAFTPALETLPSPVIALAFFEGIGILFTSSGSGERSERISHLKVPSSHFQ